MPIGSGLSSAPPDQDIDPPPRYELRTRLIPEGTGQLWDALDNLLGELVVTTVLAGERASPRETAERLLGEALRASVADQPRRPATGPGGDGSDAQFLLIGLVTGETLSERLGREPVPRLATALTILSDAGALLGTAHNAGFVHGFVTPTNLVLMPDGDVKLTGFGLPHPVSTAGAGRTERAAAYTAPEEAAGQPPTTAGDVFSLGAIAYEMLTGRPPTAVDAAATESGTDVESLAAVPAGVRSMVVRALSTDPADRQRSAHAFATEARQQLLMIATDRPVVSPAPGADETPSTGTVTAPALPPPDSRTTRRVLPALALGAAGVVAIGLVALAIRDDDSSDRPDTTDSPTDPSASTVAVATTSAGPPASDATTGVDASAPVPATTETELSSAATTEATTSQPATSDSQPSGSSTTDERPPVPVLVSIDPTVLVGTTAGKVAFDLQRLGLVVLTEPVPSESDPGTVTSVEPTGQVPVGSTVTLYVSTGEDPATSGG